MRNEGPHCLEWIAHHLAVGIDHFLIYTNDCDDGTDLILDALETAGLVTHIRQTPKGKRPVQWQALKHATDHPMVADADWILVTDCDEFINLRGPYETLKDMIAKLPKGVDAMALTWRLFGHSGQIEMRDELTIKRFTHAAPTDLQLPLAHFFKSLFRPAAFRQIGIHRPKRKHDRLPNWVDGGGNPLSESFAKQDGRINMFGIQTSTDLVQLNHYSLRSAESFMVKRARGLPNHTKREIGLGYWVERNFNIVEDTSIQQMIAATQGRLDQLMQIRTVSNLHKKACQCHKDRFNEMMTNRADIQLFWQLTLSGTSQAPGTIFARTQINRIIKAENQDG